MYDPKWKYTPFPNCIPSIRWGLYGCYATCLGMFLGKTPPELITENPHGWDSQGNMASDSIMRKYGYKIIRTPLVEGHPIPEDQVPCILRTSYYNQTDPVTGKFLSGYRMGFPTHFFWYLGKGIIVDPATSNTKEDIDHRGYLKYCNERRTLVKTN